MDEANEGVRKIHFKRQNVITKLSFLFISILISQNLYGLKYPVKFERMPLEPGEVTANIFSIAQDSTGYIWIGTPSAIYRYNGCDFTKFPIKTNIDQQGTVRNIVVDPSNNIWFKLKSRSIGRLDPHSGTFQPVIDNPSAISSSINCFTFINDTMWLSTISDRLFRYIPETDQMTQILDSNQINTGIHRLLPIQRDIWIGSTNGIYKYNIDRNDLKYYSLKQSSCDSLRKKIIAIHQDRTGVIWIACNYGIIYKYNEKSDRFDQYYIIPGLDLSNPKFQITSMICDNTNHLLFGTIRQGLAYLNLTTGNFVSSSESRDQISGIEPNYISKIFIDNNGVLWLGTPKPGLYKEKGHPKFFHYLLSSSDDSLIVDNYVQSIQKDNQGDLYIGTYQDGLYQFDSNHNLKNHFLAEPDNSRSLCENNIYAMLSENDGNLWIATSDGLEKFIKQTNEFIHYRLDRSDITPILTQLESSRRKRYFEKCNRFVCLFKDKNQNIWIGTYSGILAKFDCQAETFKIFRYHIDEWKSADGITTIEEDQYGNLWIGTVWDGIHIFDPVEEKYLRFHRFSDSPDSLSSNQINTIHKDSHNLMWIGHSSAGISVYDDNIKKFKTYRDIDGLLNNRVTGLVEDNYGYLWISTMSGLSSFEYTTQSITNYTHADGVDYYYFNIIPTDQVQLIDQNNGIHQTHRTKINYNSCAYQNSDENIYFGGNNGYIIFNPKDLITEESNQSNLVLTDFKIFTKSQINYRPFNNIKEIELSYKDYIFSFDYSLLNFISPEENTYSHILEGFEKEWSDPSIDRTVTYWNIPPGNYTLKIKGTSKYGSWCQNPLEINITITPPFWKTLWFKIISILSIAAVIGLVFHQRLQRIKKQKIELEKQVKERTIELHESNKHLIEEIQFRKKAEAELRKSEEEYRDLFENAYDVIWISDINGKIQAINNYFLDLLGYEKEQIIGDNLINHVSESHRFRTLRNYYKLKRDHKVECEIEIITKKGSQRILWIKIRGIFDNGKLVGIHGIGRDSTELKKAQAELQEAERIKRESMKQLTLKLAHEIKNPLTSITSSAQLVASSKDTRENLKIQRHMGIINKNVNICNRVIRELYTFTNKPIMQMATVDTAVLISGIVSYANEKTEQNPKIRIESNIETDLPPVLADKFRLEQALKNLINNAFEAIQDSGTVEIKASSDSLHQNVKIEITDTGVGLTEEELQNIFKPFQTSKTTGFGLGLPVVKDIIDAHKGSTIINSEPNKGTTFTIILSAIKTAKNQS